MQISLLHLQIIGILLIILASVHVVFPRYFHWKEVLKPLPLLERQIFYVHTFFVALTVLGMGILSLVRTESLINTPLGRDICLTIGIFWLLRLLFQLFVYSPKLWREKTMESTVHVIFTILWTYLTTAFLIIAFS
ncbi:MAG: hypothetical protein MK081_07600 [Flavobacteriales bacterium]|nr:hypothetical protein [Flavobacteriales bacterium]